MMKWRMMIAAVGVVLVGTLQSIGLPVLDEDTYLYIAENMYPKRPYDWSLPWPPYDEGEAFVYAHPPLFLWWVWLIHDWFALSVGWSKWIIALPAQILFGLAAAVLLEKRQHMGIGLLLFLSTPIVSISIARGLMPDLSVSALGAAGLVAWWYGVQKSDLRVSAFAGGLLGLAAWTKYPALLLVLVPIIHSTNKKHLLVCLGAWALVWGGGEFWLWTIYDRMHLLEVLQRAAEIGRGPPLPRISGVLVRLSVGAPLILLVTAGHGRWAIWGGLVGSALWWLSALPIPLLPLVVIGSAGVFSLCGISLQGQRDSWLATWALLVIVGVLGGHNFAAPRYCLPAMLPLVVLAVSRLRQAVSMRLMQLVLGVSIALSLVIGIGERSYARAASDLADEVIESHPVAYFSGEWTFRYKMRQAGWSFWRGEALCNTQVAIALQAAPAAVSELWRIQQERDGQTGSIRLLQANTSTGYYAETVGKMPMMWSYGPLERVQIWGTPKCSTP